MRPNRPMHKIKGKMAAHKRGGIMRVPHRKRRGKMRGGGRY